MTAAYHDGQALLPTAVIAGDVVEVLIEGDALRLMLQKPTPQKNILINANFKDPANQRQAKNVEAFQYGIDMWSCGETSHTVEDGYLNIPAGGVLTYRFDGLTATRFLGKMVTVCIALEDGLHIGSNIYNGEATTNFIDDSTVLGYKYGTDRQFQFLAKKAFKARFVKMELGNRYTGWHDPSPGETLAECQRYQLAVNGSHYFGGGVYSARGSTYVIPTPVTMRAKPVLTKWVVKYGAMDSNGNAGSVLTASVVAFSENSIKVDVTVNNDLAMGPSVLREATFFFDANV